MENIKQQKCPRDDCKNNAIIDITLGVLPCQKCQDEDEAIANAPEFYNQTKQHRVQEQRDKHNADIMQPWAEGKDMKPNPDFVRAYPGKARDYFTDEQLKKI
jgi:ribosomal protein L37AE/L43A